MPSPTLLWFRLDLRLSDNPALAAALKRGQPCIPVYILDDTGEAPWAPGAASRWWLHHALADLREQLRQFGHTLILRRGDSQAVLQQLIHETSAGALYWNRRYEPAITARDTRIKADLKATGLDVQSFNSHLLFEPWDIRNQSKKPFQVFTPYWKHCLTHTIPEPIPSPPAQLKPHPRPPASDHLDSWQLLPSIPWDLGFQRIWTPTRQGAEKRLDLFVSEALTHYGEDRDRPYLDGTSCLSPYLHFGQLGPREIHHALDRSPASQSGGTRKYFAELGWREFSHHILHHFPHTPEEPLRSEYARFPWEQDEALLTTWQQGRTGYPLVDAGMRQLWAIGWMHNRVRMVTASLLVKHLLQPWQDGARWFWDTLVDADLAANTQGWQWTAGCGADGAPYFRVFNPTTQGQRFDPDGDYVRRWVPELAKLPPDYIHRPWETPPLILQAANITLGKDYPHPIIEHKHGRHRALQAYEKLKHFQPGKP